VLGCRGYADTDSTPDRNTDAFADSGHNAHTDRDPDTGGIAYAPQPSAAQKPPQW